MSSPVYEANYLNAKGQQNTKKASVKVDGKNRFYLVVEGQPNKLLVLAESDFVSLAVGMLMASSVAVLQESEPLARFIKIVNAGNSGTEPTPANV